MMLLAFDASTPAVTVAVGREDGGRREVLSEVTTIARGASETLLLGVEAALKLADVELGAMDRIVAGVGPGTFTGIRISLSTARALALATGISIATNSTLSALAAPILPLADPVLAVIDAKRGQVFAQRFSHDAPDELFCLRPNELPPDLLSASLVVGDGAIRYREELSGLGPVPPDGSPFHRVTAAGHLLAADLAPVPVERVVPLYMREPDAEARRDLNPWARS
jgi:tRNA threonylcarbamoyladenosine biosynthesis protein TsaB